MSADSINPPSDMSGTAGQDSALTRKSFRPTFYPVTLKEWETGEGAWFNPDAVKSYASVTSVICSLPVDFGDGKTSMGDLAFKASIQIERDGCSEISIHPVVIPSADAEEGSTNHSSKADVQELENVYLPVERLSADATVEERLAAAERLTQKYYRVMEDPNACPDNKAAVLDAAANPKANPKGSLWNTNPEAFVALRDKLEEEFKTYTPPDRGVEDL
jgi:hypothetical protein